MIDINQNLLKLINNMILFENYIDKEYMNNLHKLNFLNNRTSLNPNKTHESHNQSNFRNLNYNFPLFHIYFP